MIAPMLQFLFRASQSIAMRGLFAILLFAFIIFGIGDVFRSRGSSGDVATVARESITPQQLTDAFQHQLTDIGRRFGGKVDPAMAKRAGLLERVLDALINDMTVGLAAHDEGFLISDKLVIEDIQQNPNLQDPVTKTFSREIFNQVLQQQRLTEIDVIRREKMELAKRVLLDSELGPIHPPILLRDVYHRFQGEKRRGEVIHVNSAAMTVPAATADQLADYYHKHEADFTAPEFRDFSFLYLDADDLAKSMNVTAEELQQAYDARQADFKTPERRELSQVILHDKTKADQVAALAQSGKTLAAAAKEAGSNEASTDLGLMSKQDLPDALQQPVFSAAANSILPPVKTALGWHVIQVHRIEAGHQLNFDESKAALEAELKAEKARDQVTETTKHIDDQLAGGASLTEAGKPFGLSPITVKAVSAEGKHPDGAPVGELIGRGAVLKTAFSVDKNATPQATEDRGSAYAVTVDQITPPALKPLDSVKAKISDAYIAEAKQQAANTLATSLIQKSAQGTSFAELAKQANTIVTPVGPFLHSAAEKGDSAPIAAALFNSTRTAEVKLASSASGPALVQLSEIIDPAPFTPEQQADADKFIQGQLQGDFRSGYENSLRQIYPVKIDKDVLEKLKSSN